MLPTLFRYLLPIILWATFNTSLAVEVTPESPPQQTINLDQLSEQLDVIEQDLHNAGTNTALIDTLSNKLVGIAQQAQTCLDNYGKQASQTQSAMDSLGSATVDETPEVTTKRKELEALKQQTEKNLSQCRLVSLRANTLLDEARNARQDILKRQLLAPSAPALRNIQALLLNPDRWQIEMTDLAQKLPDLLLKDWEQTLVALAYGLTGMLAGLLWSVYKRRRYRVNMPAIHDTSPTLAAVWRSFLRVIPYVLFAGFTALSLYISTQKNLPLLQFMLILLMFSLSYGIVHSMLRVTSKVEGIIPLLDEKTGKNLQVWARILLFSTVAGIILHTPELNTVTIQDSTTPNNLISVLRSICGSLIGFALARLIWLISRHFIFIQRIRLHLLVSFVLSVAVISLWLGYRNFAIFLFSGVFGTLFLLLAAWLLIRIPTEIFDGLDEGHAQWQHSLRQRLGLRQTQVIPGLIWLRVANILLIGGGLIILLLRLWGMPEQDFSVLLQKLSAGFQVAGFTVEPLRIINGLLVITLLVSLTHVFKTYFSEHWLRRTNLSRGAREASTTIVGYIGILLAILLGLSVAGIELENLAIIAGALSVGIGFGLQNIVNNFVSGLILLFERPIRRGDWIKVGDAEGHVRDISIRSTTIQTFERSDIIVPNSEIISGQVTNMVLHDSYGRIIISIGVAYGSDTELVMKILRQVADNHPAIMNSQGVKTSVFFSGFGDNALNFELRCYIRDVESKLAVKSDLNLAVDKAFRQHGIDVPFPQRTIHVVQESFTHQENATSSK